SPRLARRTSAISSLTGCSMLGWMVLIDNLMQIFPKRDSIRSYIVLADRGFRCVVSTRASRKSPGGTIELSPALHSLRKNSDSDGFWEGHDLSEAISCLKFVRRFGADFLPQAVQRWGKRRKSSSPGGTTESSPTLFRGHALECIRDQALDTGNQFSPY